MSFCARSSFSSHILTSACGALRKAEERGGATVQRGRRCKELSDSSWAPSESSVHATRRWCRTLLRAQMPLTLGKP